MKQFILPITLAGIICATTEARTWTSTAGKEVEADVVFVNADRTVALKTSGGKTVTVPFNTFVVSDVEHLDYLLSRKGRGKLHALPWNELNDLFGINIWQDDYLWDDPTAETAARTNLKKESKTDYMENYRAYPLGKKKILNEAVYSIALYGGESTTESLSFVFTNMGDRPAGGGETTSHMIDECGLNIENQLVPHLGEPKRDSLGKGDMREKVWRWDWNGHAIMLSVQDGKYAALRIMPVERAERSGRVEKIKEGDLKKRMASCVEQRDNGDVIIRNVPMINQGPKGYCSPATWERYLRYMDIPVDMYLLALAGNTGRGGGTYAHEMVEATASLISGNGRELEPIGGSLDPESIAEYIDLGLPIMWRFLSTPDFQRAANDNTAKRNGKEPKKKKAGQAEDTGSGGHICLIIGYNKQTGEIAISDSWGPRFAERWVKAYEAQNVSYGSMNIIKW